MTTALLVVIYAAFVSLGLPDALLGSAWPVMGVDLGVPVSAAGAISMTIAGGTIISALSSGRVLGRFGTGRVTAFSTLATALSLFGFAVSPGFIWLVVLAFPLGLGAGAIDTGINDYVARNFAAHHMNWLHGFWGLGAMGGPLIVAQFIRAGSWRSGYSTVASIQLGLAVVLLVTVPLWRRVERAHGTAVPPGNTGPDRPTRGIFYPLRLTGTITVLMIFLFYCGVEWTMGIWGSTFLVRVKQFDAARAAEAVSVYYGSITAGRLLNGFVSMRFTSRAIVRSSQVAILVGVALLLLPGAVVGPAAGAAAMIGFALIGLGCAPIFPTMIHEIPRFFGAANAGHMIGFQMAVAYAGTTALPPLFGVVAEAFGFGLFAPVLFGYGALMLVASERFNAMSARRRQAG